MNDTPAQPEPKTGWFTQLKAGLSRTSNSLTENLSSVVTKRKLDDETLDELEEVLIKADLGVAMADRIREALSRGRYDKGLTDNDPSSSWWSASTAPARPRQSASLRIYSRERASV